MNLGDPYKNTPPLKRVDLNAKERDYPDYAGRHALAEAERRLDADRIWSLVVETSRTSSP